MNIGKQDERLLHEILSKYKQGIISGLYPGNNITFTPTGCRDKIISSTSSGTEGGIQSIQEGDNVTVDNTDPLNPIISVQDITLSGEVTGSTSLSAIDKTAITNKTTETIVGTDYVLFGDTSDGDNLKKGLVSDIVALSGGGGGGGDIFITKTKAEIDALISTNALVKGATYKITGVHPTLYDDGTTSGTTIILKAISENVLETQGTGIFYNPKYNQAIGGFGIWDNKMYGAFSTIVGNFDYQNKETVTADNSATGILLADGIIQYISGDWSSATSITGDVSSATADVADFVSPSYAVNDKVIWGGYSWTNVNGNIGASTDVLTLDSEWIKDVYDTTNYNIAYDVIEYDYANNWISRRYEAESNVDVKITKSNFDLLVNNYGLIYSSISVQQFGNPFDFNIVKGIFNKSINNAYDESINFSGSYQYNLTFGQISIQYNLTFGQSSGQSGLIFGTGSYQYNLTFGQNSYQYNLTFGTGSYQYNLIFRESSSQSDLTFGQSSGQFNLTFGAGSGQYNLIFGQDSYQNNLTFGQNSYQFNLTFGQNSQVDFNNQTLNSNMEYIDFKTKNITVPDLSSATYIFDGNVKEVYQRPDGTIKLKFMNNSDVLEVHGIAD